MPSLKQATNMRAKGQWFCWSKNCLGAHNISNLTMKTPASSETAQSTEAPSTSGPHKTSQAQPK